MPKDSSILGGAGSLIGAPATVTGGSARPKVGREVSPFVPRQPQPLPEEKPPAAETVVTVGPPQFLEPPVRESGEGAPSGVPGEGGAGDAPGPGEGGGGGGGDTGGDTGVGGESGSGIGGDAW